VKTQVISLIILLIICLVQPLHVVAQSDRDQGDISGKLVDSETGESLIGANVIIEGSQRGVPTDIDGTYRISNLDPGIYSIRATYVSYQSKVVKGVEIKPGQSTTLNFSLSPESVGLDEVVITARSIQNTDAALLAKRQKSTSFSDAISSESIARSGSGDAAEAMTKVVGASVMEGKYVYVRGLGDRYSGTQLNGSNLPSADPDRNSFQMDLFPSGLIDNITTLKTFTPDKPGTFTGGLVDVSTKDFPNNFSMSVSASTTYNTQVTGSEMLYGYYGESDFLGFDNGRRAVPDQIKSYLNGDLEIPGRNRFDLENNTQDSQLLLDLSNSLNKNIAPVSNTAPVDQSYSFSIGNNVPLGGGQLFGYSASLSYKNSVSGYNDGAFARFVQIGSDDQATALSSNINLGDQSASRSTDIGGMVTLAYRPSPNHKFSTTYLKTQNGTASGRFLQGSYESVFNDDETVFQSRTMKYVERGLNSVQGKGKHFFKSLMDLSAEWSLSYAQNTQDEPDFRLFQNQYRYFPGFDQPIYSMPSGNFNIPPSRYYRELEENNISANVDISVPFQSFTAQRGKFKIGSAYTTVDRGFRENRLEYELPNSRTYNLNDAGGDPDTFISQTGLITDDDGNQVLGLTIKDATSLRSNYDAERAVESYYAMIELPLASWVEFVGGYRVEMVDMNVASFDPDLEQGNLDNTDWLPSYNLIFSLSDKMNVRAAYTQTIARPTFREISPYITFDFVGDFLFRGNANLERTQITNYDLRWEWFTNPGEIFAISGFYKKFDQPLERVIRIDLGNDVASIQNVDAASVYGLEFELSQQLDFWNMTRDFSVSTNYTRVFSHVDVPRMELIEILNVDPNATETEINQAIKNAPNSDKERELVGQSPYTLNFDVAYNNQELGLNASVNYNLFGDRLFTVQRGATPDTYERGYGTLNFVSSYQLIDNLRLKLSVKNILDPDIKRSQNFKGEEYISSSYKRGRSIGVGVSYTFK
jgi:TonB-dependent receptor